MHDVIRNCAAVLPFRGRLPRNPVSALSTGARHGPSMSAKSAVEGKTSVMLLKKLPLSCI